MDGHTALPRLYRGLTLQFVPENTRTELYRTKSGGGGGAWCPLPEQWGAMYVYDALVYNPGRAQTSMVYNLENWQLMLNNNGDTFGTKRGRPPYLRGAPLKVNSYWKQALAGLDDETLTANLGDVLDQRRIDALAKRRDLLLQTN